MPMSDREKIRTLLPYALILIALIVLAVMDYNFTVTRG